MESFLEKLKKCITKIGKIICYIWLSIYAILSIMMLFMFVTTYINPVQEILTFFGLLSFQIIIPVLALTWNKGKKFRIRTLIVFALVFFIGLGLGTQGVSETKDEYYARIESANREDLTESEKSYVDKKNEEKRIAEEQRIEEERVEAERQAEQARIEAERQAEIDRIAAEEAEYYSQFDWYNNDFGIAFDGNKSQNGIVYVRGRLMPFKKDYTYIQIEFDLLNSNGSKVGTAFTNVSGLAKGQTWEFEAIGTGNNVSSVTFKDVSGW